MIFIYSRSKTNGTKVRAFLCGADFPIYHEKLLLAGWAAYATLSSMPFWSRTMKQLALCIFITFLISAPMGNLHADDRAQRELDYAKELVKRGLYDLALIVYRDFDKNFPTHEKAEDIEIEIGKLFLKQGKYDEAMAAFETFLQKRPYSGRRDEIDFWIAEIYYAQGKYETALALYRRIVNLANSADISYVKSEYNIGWCLLKLKKYDDAIKVFTKFAALYRDTDLGLEARLAIGDCHLQMKRYGQAAKRYSQVLSIAKTRPKIISKANYGLGRVAYESGRYGKAIRYFEKSAGLGKREPNIVADALWWKAKCHEEVGDKESSRKTLTEIVEKYPSSSRAQQAKIKLASYFKDNIKSGSLSLNELTDEQIISVGDADYAEKNYDKAIEWYEIVVSRSSGSINSSKKSLPANSSSNEAKASIVRTSARAYYGIGQAYAALGRYPEAAKAFEESAGICEQLAPKQGLMKIKKALDNYPSSIPSKTLQASATDALYEAAVAYTKADDVKSLRRVCQKLTDEHPHHSKTVKAQYLLADMLFGRKEYYAAAEAYQEMVNSEWLIVNERQPLPISLRKALFRVGYSLYLAQKFSDAAQAFKIFLDKLPSLAADPRAAKAMYLLGDALLRAGKLSEAEATFQEFLDKFASDDSTPYAYYQLGYIREKRDDLTGAIEEYRNAINIKPDGAIAPEAEFRIAMVLYKQGKTGEAVHDFLDAANKKVLPAQVYLWLANELFKAKRAADAASMLDLVIKHYANDKNEQENVELAFYRKGQYCMDEREWDKAIISYETLLSRFPNTKLYPQAKFDLANCLRNKGNLDEAIRTLKDLAAAARGKLALKVQYEIADCWIAKGDFDAATKILLSLIILYNTPENDDWMLKAYFKLGVCYEELKQTAKAVDYYKKVTKFNPTEQSLKEMKDRAQKKVFILNTM